MGKQDWDWDVSIGSNFDTSLKIGKPYWDYERNVVSLGRLPARLQCPEHARVIASRRHWDPSWFHMRTKKSLQLMSQGYRVSWRYFKISCQLVLLCSIKKNPNIWRVNFSVKTQGDACFWSSLFLLYNIYITFTMIYLCVSQVLHLHIRENSRTSVDLFFADFILVVVVQPPFCYVCWLHTSQGWDHWFEFMILYSLQDPVYVVFPSLKY